MAPAAGAADGDLARRWGGAGAGAAAADGEDEDEDEDEEEEEEEAAGCEPAPALAAAPASRLLIASARRKASSSEKEPCMCWPADAARFARPAPSAAAGESAPYFAEDIALTLGRVCRHRDAVGPNFLGGALSTLPSPTISQLTCAAAARLRKLCILPESRRKSRAPHQPPRRKAPDEASARGGLAAEGGEPFACTRRSARGRTRRA